MALAFRVLARNGIRRFCLADPMNDADANVACARMVKQGGGEYVIAALVFTLSPIHDDAHYVERARKLAAQPGRRRALHQGSGRAAVAATRARTLIPAIKAVIGDEAARAARALHDRPRRARRTWMPPSYGVERRAVRIRRRRGRHLEPAVASASSRTCARSGTPCDIDDDGAGRGRPLLHALAEAEGLPVGRPQAFDAAYLHHQLPGGMVGTMRRQLAESARRRTWKAR